MSDKEKNQKNQPGSSDILRDIEKLTNLTGGYQLLAKQFGGVFTSPALKILNNPVFKPLHGNTLANQSDWFKTHSRLKNFLGDRFASVHQDSLIHKSLKTSLYTTNIADSLSVLKNSLGLKQFKNIFVSMDKMLDQYQIKNQQHLQLVIKKLASESLQKNILQPDAVNAIFKAFPELASGDELAELKASKAKRDDNTELTTEELNNVTNVIMLGAQSAEIANIDAFYKMLSEVIQSMIEKMTGNHIFVLCSLVIVLFFLSSVINNYVDKKSEETIRIHESINLTHSKQNNGDGVP